MSSRAIRAEILKLRTAPMTWGLLGATAIVTVLLDVLIGARAGAGRGRVEIAPLTTLSGQTTLFTTTQLALLLAMVLGVIVAAGEFRHGTATATALATPRRARALIAKTVVAGGMGLLFGLVGVLVSAGIGVAFLAAQGDTFLITTATLLRDGVGTCLGAGLLATVGVGVGSLLRSQVAGVVTVLIWALAGEGGLGALFPAASPYFPFNAARSMGGVSSFAGGTVAAPFYVAGLLVVAVAIALGGIAAQSTVRRDIS
jgi:ABC-2 type transport system permease protein